MTVWMLNAAPWIGVALGAIGLVGALWALSPWPRSARRRCPRCWYDVSGTLGSVRCTECGRTARSESRLHKRRRRWRVAMLGMFVMVLGGAAAATPDVVHRTWPRLVPTSVLYALNTPGNPPSYASRPGPPSNALFIRRELETRLNAVRYASPLTSTSFWMGWPRHIERPFVRSQARRMLRTSRNESDKELAIECLSAFGLIPADVSVLRPALGPGSGEGLQYRATRAVAELGPDAAVCLPEIIANLLDLSRDWGYSAEIEAIGAIGPAAAPSVESLRLLLWSNTDRFGSHRVSYSDERADILGALAAIGAPARTVAPDILELYEIAPPHRAACACTLICIDPDATGTFECCLELLRSTDVAAHASLKEAFRDSHADALRTRILQRLTSDLTGPDGCTRIAGMRALTSLDAIPSDVIPALASDPDATVRLFAEAALKANRP